MFWFKVIPRLNDLGLENGEPVTTYDIAGPYYKGNVRYPFAVGKEFRNARKGIRILL